MRVREDFRNRRTMGEKIDSGKKNGYGERERERKNGYGERK